MKNLPCSEPQLALKRERFGSLSNEAMPQQRNELPRLAEKSLSIATPFHVPVAHLYPLGASTPKAREAILLLAISEVIDMALEELVTLADDLAKPFINDPRYTNPRDSIYNLKDSIDELQWFGHRLESRALQLRAGDRVSLIQSVLRNKYYSKRLIWTSKQSALEEVQRSIDMWDQSDYPGVAHVLQMKLLLEQPHLMPSNIKSFLKYEKSFVDTAADLLKRPEIRAPQIVRDSQLFLPCTLARFPDIVTHLAQRGLPDCLGRSVSHILYDAGKCYAEVEHTGTQINSRDVLGRTLLYLACHKRDRGGVMQYLGAGAELDIQAVNGLRPLDIAAITGDSMICKEICNSADMKSRKILDEAAEKRKEILDKEINDCEQIYGQAKNTDQEVFDQTPSVCHGIHDQAHQEAKQISKSSLDQANKVSMNAHYDPNLCGSSRSPLIWAAFFGHIDVVKYLRNTRNSVRALIDRHGYSAIGLAAMHGHSNVIKYLISCKLPSDTSDMNGRSPFWYAARASHCDTMLLLQSAGAFVDRKDNDGYTPLAVAAREGHAEAVAFLLDEDMYRFDPQTGIGKKRRANILLTNNLQQTPLVLAASAGRAKCVDLLLQLGSKELGEWNIRQAYEAAQRNGCSETCASFLSDKFAFILLYGNIFGHSDTFNDIILH
ncbi:Nn.00g028900.m01.CDS01 [Neocucurbitaria sp. VM-36]